MTDDQQAGTLAFLQNFYTGVTLYMPFEAEERRAVAAPAAPSAAPVVAAVQPPVAPAAAVQPTVVPAPPVAAAPRPAAPAPVPAPAAAPAPVVAPAPPAAGKLPSLASLPATPAVAPVRPAAPPAPASQPPAPAMPAPPATSPPAEVPGYLRTTFDTLGSNQQGVVLLVRLPDAQFQKLPRNVFLNKLLQAINLVMADVVLVNVTGPYPVALENLRREVAATQVLAFGKNLLDVAVRTTQIYEPVRFFNLNLDYLAAAEVEMVEYDVSLKKRLWGGLQAMFL